MGVCLKTFCWDGPNSVPELGLGMDSPRTCLSTIEDWDWDGLGTVPIRSQERFETILELSWDWFIDYSIAGTGTVSGRSQDWDGTGTGQKH